MVVLPRIITAILGIPIMLVAIYYGSSLFIFLSFVILIYMVKEYVYLVNSVGYQVNFFLSLLSGTAIFFSVIIEQLNFFKENFFVTSIVITALIFLFYFYEILRQEPQGAVGRISVGFLGPFLIAWSLAHLFLIRDIRPKGFEYTISLFLTIWFSDTSSFVFGTLWGRKKLVKQISPRKSVVGLFSGLVTSVTMIIFFRRIFNFKEIDINEAIILGLIISLLSLFSDLSESLIKRDCNVKDSDNLLPGHGGMLDRFDSFLFTAPAYYYLLTQFLKE